MPNPSSNGVRNSRKSRFIWSLTLILVTIGLLAAARRAFVLLVPPQGPPRFAAAAAMDAGFAQHKALTLAHILPASLFMALTTVAKYMVKRRKPPSQTWRTFLENHVTTLVSVDFFTVPTIRFPVLYVFLVLSH